MERKTCAHCGNVGVPNSVLACRACGLPVGQEVWALPSSDLGNAEGRLASRNRPPFSLKAARFSFYAPIVLLVFCAMLPMRHVDDEFAWWEGAWVGLLALATLSAGFWLGVCGAIGGVKRRSVWTIVLALLGLVLNGIPLAILFIGIVAE